MDEVKSSTKSFKKDMEKKNVYADIVIGDETQGTHQSFYGEVSTQSRRKPSGICDAMMA